MEKLSIFIVAVLVLAVIIQFSTSQLLGAGEAAQGCSFIDSIIADALQGEMETC